MSAYMMATARTDPQLGSRLERLTGEEASCCVSGYRSLTDRIRKDPDFRARLLRAQVLADESRYLTLELLRREKELCACEIQAALGVTHATVSHHMRALLEAGLVSAERRGKWVYYRLTEQHGQHAAR
jgi:DNA-binding transcriptional ArsR family regulator